MGHPCSAVTRDHVLRQNTGYVSFGRSSKLTLSSPRDFTSTAMCQALPVSGRDYDYFSHGDGSRTPRNVTFRDARHRRHKHHDPAPELSHESSGEEDLEETRHHIAGGSRDGATHPTPPITFGGLHGGASPRPTPPHGVLDGYSGASQAAPTSSMNCYAGRRGENIGGHSQGGGSAGDHTPRQFLAPLRLPATKERKCFLACFAHVEISSI